MNRRLKGAMRSRTVWFNTLAGALTTALPALKDALPTLQPYITPAFYGWLVIGVVIGNIVLRVITTTALEEKQ